MFTIFRKPQGEFATLRDRQRWARSIDALLRDAEKPATVGGPRGVRPLYSPRVVSACAPALRHVRDVLLDTRTDVRTVTLRKLHAFVCDGVSSPLLGRNPEAAKRGALELRGAFDAARHAQPRDTRQAA
jgi:hypothetical protein